MSTSQGDGGGRASVAATTLVPLLLVLVPTVRRPPQKLNNITSEGDCCEACVGEPECISWTLNHYSSECHLKDAVASPSNGNCTSGGSAGVNRPHILLITSDQQRTDTISAYHGDRGVIGQGLISPNVDKLAAQGVRWTEALVTSPVCSPCRTSLLTGVHVPVHKVVGESRRVVGHLLMLPS